MAKKARHHPRIGDLRWVAGHDSWETTVELLPGKNLVHFRFQSLRLSSVYVLLGSFSCLWLCALAYFGVVALRNDDRVPTTSIGEPAGEVYLPSADPVELPRRREAA